MAVHMLRVRDVGRRRRVELSVLGRLGGLSDVLVGMHEVMLRGKMVGGMDQSGLIVGDRLHSTELTATPRPWFLGVASKNPELGIVGEGGQRLTQGSLVGLVALALLFGGG